MSPIPGPPAPRPNPSERRLAARSMAAALAFLTWSGWFVDQPLASGASGVVGRSAGAGLSMSVDTRWLDGGGYRPVRLQFTPTGPIAADRTLSVTFRAKHMYYQPREVVVTQDVDIPAGSTGVTVTLSVPQHFFWHMADCEVYEDGRYLKTLSQIGMGIGNWNQAWSEGLPNILLLAPPAAAGFIPAGGIATPATVAANPDTSVLSRVLPVEQYASRSGVVSSTGQSANGVTLYQLDSMLTVPPEHLPPRWLDYTNVDLLLAPWGELKKLPDGQPQAWLAIVAWTRAGGNLLVFDVGTDFAALQELESQLKWDDNATVDADPMARGWQEPSRSRRTLYVDPPFGIQGQFGGYGVATPVMPVATPVPGEIPPESQPIAPVAAPVPDKPPFLTRPFGMGMVVAMTGAQPFADPPEDWGWLLNTLGSDRWLWYRRYGLSLERENESFWNWLVPGVGLAPVTEFRVLITVFVLLIGPVNYYWLRRQGRLHLLLMIVPFCAAAITLGLFGYALVADGLGVRARVRSYTEIDQLRGQAVCWSRVSYYAGLAPLDGLAMPTDQAVFPLDPEQAGGGSGERHRHVNWLSDEQNLASGWLASRTPSQSINVSSRSCRQGVDFMAATGGRSPQIANRLETRIERLLLADDQGKCFRAVDVADGATVDLQPVDPVEELIEFRTLISSRGPAIPDGMTRDRYSNMFGFNSGRYYYNSSNQGLPGAEIDTGRLERSIQQVMVDPGFMQPQAGGPGPRAIVGHRRRWLAIVEQSPEVDVGVPRFRNEGGLHVMQGRW